MAPDQPPPQPQNNNGRKFSFGGDVIKRTISGLILAPLAIAVIYLGGALYSAMIAAGIIILSFEWKNMIAAKNPQSRKLELLGLVYILLPGVSLLWLRSIEDGYGASGRAIIFWVVSIVWATDIAGYFAGRYFGGRKLAPSISPGKTWAGLFGALAATLVVAVVAAFTIKAEHIIIFIVISLAISIISQIGDLFESFLKRRFDVKDSGNIIPGHGGLFDRVDGLLAAAVFTAILLAVTAGNGILK